MSRVVWVLAAAWAVVAVAFVGGWLTPDPRLGAKAPAWWPMLVPLLLALLLATFAVEKDSPADAARGARLGLALGASHVVIFVVLAGGLDMAGSTPRLVVGRAAFGALAVLLAAALLPAGRGRVRAGTVLGRCALAGAGMGAGLLAVQAGLAFMLVPIAMLVGAAVGLAFGVVDLAFVWLVQTHG